MIKGQFATLEEAQEKVDSENTKAIAIGIPVRAVIIPQTTYRLMLIPAANLSEFNGKPDNEKAAFAQSSMATFNQTPLTEEQFTTLQTAYNEYTNNNQPA